MSEKYVVIRDMSAGNAETGDAWQETKIFDSSATLREVMLWAVGMWSSIRDEPYLPKSSNKRVTITIPHSEATT